MLNTTTTLRYPQPRDVLRTCTTIGIDIDGVLADTVQACIKKVQQDYGMVMEYTDWKHWNPHENTPLQKVWITKQEDTVIFFEDIVHRHSIPPIVWAPEWVLSLKQVWKNLIALTGRDDSTQEVTTKLIDDHYWSQFDTILFSNHDVPEKKKSKSQVAKENGIELMIEDNIHYSIELAKNDIPTILLTQPWNQDEQIPEWLPIWRINSWQEIVNYV